MIYYLLFCSFTSYGGSVCINPTPLPSREACLFVLAKQIESTGDGKGGRGRCVGIRK